MQQKIEGMEESNNIEETSWGEGHGEVKLLGLHSGVASSKALVGHTLREVHAPQENFKKLDVRRLNLVTFQS